MFLNCGVGEDSWEFLDCKEIKLVNPKGNQSWIFIGRTDAEAETLILWPPDVKSWLIGKDHDAGKDWRREKGTTEDEMVGWHHRLNGRVWASSRSWWWTGKPGMLQSIASQSWTQLSDWTDWLTSKGLTCPCRRCKRQEFDLWVGKIPWRRKWQPTPIFLPGKFMDTGAQQAKYMGTHRVGHNWTNEYTHILQKSHWGGWNFHNLAEYLNK